MNTSIGVGILGAGTVGGTLISRLVNDREAIAAKTGLELCVKRVAVRDLARARSFTVGDGVLTDD
ncbi:MAG: homoserine dehydrogenase, partial [Actinomycetota bacterium]|nr:homoserine dehydrogenase [Actinomycetota bacterium]